VGDMPGVLLTMPTEPGVPRLKRLIWQQREVVVEMLSQTLSDAEMLAAAAGVAHGQ
jgi:hypothetical protein